MRECKICNLKFDNNKTYSNHVRWKHKEQPYQIVSCKLCNERIAACGIKNHERFCKKRSQQPKNCKQCSKELVQLLGNFKKFCNSSCAATYSNSHKDYSNTDKSYITPEWRKKMGEITKRQWREGKHKVNRKFFSSKNERAIVKHFKETYPRDSWKTAGRLVLEDGTFLARDLWSDKLKICFEYDGIWHFKDIHGQLKKKQTKDRLLEEWCKENNYRLIRIDENNYKDIKQIENLIYNQKEQIIKVGDRY
jgi:hypothetical protein